MSDAPGISASLASFVPPDYELTDWLQFVSDRFGFDESLFEGLAFVVGGKTFLFVTSRSHHPPDEPPPDTIGLPVIRLQHKYLKLTTEGAMLWGGSATRNVVELNRAEADAYLHRKDNHLSDDQLSSVTGRGFVIVRHSGLTLGVGLYLADASKTLQSLYPKSHALVARDSAFSPTRGES